MYVGQSLSCVQLFVTPWTAACQAPLSSTISQICSDSCLLNWWCNLLISSPAALFSFCLQSFPASESFPMSRIFESGGIGASASVLQWIFRVDFLYDWLVWSPCCPRDSQESSLALQFESLSGHKIKIIRPLGMDSQFKVGLLHLWLKENCLCGQHC